MNVTFYLDWVICAQFAGVCWAERFGLYEATGANVVVVPWQDDGRSVIEKVHAGGVCLGSSEDNLVMSAIAGGSRLQVVGAMFREPPLVLMTRRGSGIRRIGDLRGRRVAMHYDGIRIMEMVLALEGIPRDDVAIDEVAFDLSHLDRYDAVQGYAMTEPIDLAAHGVDVELIPVQHPEIKPYAQVMFTTTAALGRHGALLRRVVEATDRGWAAAVADPDTAAQVAADRMGRSDVVAAQRRMMDALHDLVHGASNGAGSAPAGQLDLDQWRRNLVTYHRFGVISRSLTLEEVVSLP